MPTTILLQCKFEQLLPVSILKACTILVRAFCLDRHHFGAHLLLLPFLKHFFAFLKHQQNGEGFLVFVEKSSHNFVEVLLQFP